MTRLIRHTLLSVRDLMVTAGPVIALALGLLILAYWLLDPMPPRRVVLATGPEQSAYAAWGERYASELRRRGFEVVLRATAGSVDNLALLEREDAGVDFAFVRNGAGAASAANGSLLSLGALFQEPIWVFYRSGAPAPAPTASTNAPRKAGGSALPALHRLGELAGKRLNVGETGSGVPQLMQPVVAAQWPGRARRDLEQHARQPGHRQDAHRAAGCGGHGVRA